jgi:hypothetical protein
VRTSAAPSEEVCRIFVKDMSDWLHSIPALGMAQLALGLYLKTERRTARQSGLDCDTVRCAVRLGVKPQAHVEIGDCLFAHSTAILARLARSKFFG